MGTKGRKNVKKPKQKDKKENNNDSEMVGCSQPRRSLF